METPISARVMRGAAYLDRVRPGWEEEIDLSSLDMRSGHCCVLGELYDAEVPEEENYLHGYDYAVKKFHWSADDAARHGFYLPYEGMPKPWDELQDEWEELITARLAAKDEDSDS